MPFSFLFLKDFVFFLCFIFSLFNLTNQGTFEHCLTTDLLNHLVFVQKVFMAEVNDVLTKVSGGDKPVPLWEDNYNTVGRAT